MKNKYADVPTSDNFLKLVELHTQIMHFLHLSTHFTDKVTNVITINLGSLHFINIHTVFKSEFYNFGFLMHAKYIGMF